MAEGIARAQELRRQAAQLLSEVRSVIDTAEGADRELTADEQARVDQGFADYDKLKTRYERIEQAEDRERELAEQELRSRDAEGGDPGGEGYDPTSETAQEEYRRAYWDALAFGPANLEANQRQILERHRREVPRELRAQAIGDPALGGLTVPAGTMQRLTAALKDFGSVEMAGAAVLQTDNGQDIPFPTYNETGVYGERLGENKAVTEKDASFDEVVLKAYIYSSKKIKVPIALIQDSGVDFEGFVTTILGERIGRKQNQDFTVGEGASGPTGVVEAAATGVSAATGQATSITKADELIDLQESVDPAYRADSTIGWMMHQSSLKFIRRLKSGDGQYLLTPGLQARQPDTILGDRYHLNAEMPTMAASKKSILYGAFRYYQIRRVRGVMLFRADQLNIESFQITFIGFGRADGNLLNAGTNPIKAWINSAS